MTLQLPTPWSPGPHPKGGAAGGRPGARQPPGPPAPVAVVTARANWPVEPAGGSCSDLEGTRTSFAQALGAERWGHPEARAHWEGGGDGYFSMLRSAGHPPPCLLQRFPQDSQNGEKYQVPAAQTHTPPRTFRGDGWGWTVLFGKETSFFTNWGVMTGHAKVTRSDSHPHTANRPRRAAGF